MQVVGSLVWTFAVALAATLAVAVISRLCGSKPKWGAMLGIAVGVTSAQAVNDQLSIASKWHPLVLGAGVGVCTLIAQLFSGNAERES
jgi:hypothetical protein